jgi:hypothetical protein
MTSHDVTLSPMMSHVPHATTTMASTRQALQTKPRYPWYASLQCFERKLTGHDPFECPSVV